MPKNTTGGSGHKKRKNSNPPIRKNVDDLKKNNEFEFYAKCTKPLGNRRFEVLYQKQDGAQMTLHCRLAGSCRKKIQKDSYVLVQLFPFNLNQGQIVNVFDQEDVNALKYARLWDLNLKLESDNYEKDDPFDVQPQMDDIQEQDEDEEVQIRKEKDKENIPLDIDAEVI